MPLSKLRANRLMAEIRAQDLRFNEMEIEKFLTQMLGTQVDSPTVAVLAEKTEGWVTGLVLAAFSMRNQGRLDPAFLEPHVNAQSVMKYLFAEVFSKQSPEMTQYLINTAILDRFCGPLCEAVYMPVAEPSTDKISGWEFIARLKKENIFLIPLDAENRWFRFHHLFQQLLLNLLSRRLSREDINVLHRWASDWFAENGLIEEAIKHALDGGSSAAAVRLVEQHGFNLVSEEQWITLQRWLNLLPKDILSKDPALVILVAWTHLVSSREAELVSSLDRAISRKNDRKLSPSDKKSS